MLDIHQVQIGEARLHEGLTQCDEASSLSSTTPFSICGNPGDLYIISNKRPASNIESEEDEQDQAQFFLYYNSDSSSVRPPLYLFSHFFIR